MFIKHYRLSLGLLALMTSFALPHAEAAPQFLSHAPLRPLPQSSKRPMGNGPAKFVDAARGKDSNDGSTQRPWKSINYALRQLSPGDTLYLRGGEYFENVYCAIAGTQEKPITIRSYPGELATIDGGLPEFESTPAKAWEPAPDGVPGEYRSTKTYKNLRDVVGLFGDSNIGLQTYWYRMDLQSSNEQWIPDKDTFVKPVYCGPGMCYDKQSGRIYARLAHTKLEFPASVNYKIDQYQGETDPRKLPLVVAPYDSLPLFVDQAMHVRFQDLAFRGGGETTVKLKTAIDIGFDRCTIYAGNYGIWSKGTGPLTMTNCGVYGMIAPWMFREENVLYSYSPKVYPPFLDGEPQGNIAGTNQAQPKITRHISRMPTHAIFATEGFNEFETFAYPFNHDWQISHCAFTEGHDGVYLSGRDIYFHHNLVDNMEDDAVYVSAPTTYVTDGVYIYQNLIRRCTTGLAAHARGGPGGKIYIYRNVVDMREPVQFNRPSPEQPEGTILNGAQSAWQVHNANHIIHMEDIFMYQNTTLTRMAHPIASYGGGMPFGFWPGSQRRVFNNLHVYFGSKDYPIAFGTKFNEANLAFDGNLHWNAEPDAKMPDAETYFKTSRTNPLSEANKKYYPDGWDAHSIVGDPKFLAFQTGKANVDLRLQPDSPAQGAGVLLPADWPDPLRPKDNVRPDIGALPVGGEPLQVGIDGRTTAGEWR
jgi:hypothetical protein